MSKNILCFCWVFLNLQSRISQKTAWVLPFALRYLQLRTWGGSYSLCLCQSWATDFAQGASLPTTSMSPPGKHLSCGRASGGVLQAAPGFFTSSSYFWVGGSCHGQPLATGSIVWGQGRSLLFRRGAEASNCLAVLLAEQTYLLASPFQTVSAQPCYLSSRGTQHWPTLW